MYKEIVLSIDKKTFEKIIKRAQTLIVRKTIAKSRGLLFPLKVYLYVRDTDKIEGYVVINEIFEDFPDKKYCKYACIKFDEMKEYSGGKPLYFWSIEKVKKYKEPYLLRDFGLIKKPRDWQYVSSNKEQNINKEFHAYTDGSFNKITKVYGCGVVLIDNKGVEYRFQEKGTKYNQYWNVAGELEAAKLAIDKAKELGCTTLVIHHDYEGVGQWPGGFWRTKNEYTAGYVKFVRTCGIKVKFVHVKAHAGDKYNEIADTLSSAAAGVVVNEDKRENIDFSHHGSVKEESQRRKTTTECVILIRRFHEKEKRVFSDYVKLKVGGKDSWSAVSFDEIRKTVSDRILMQIPKEQFTEKEVASIIRWHQRGLTIKESMRKIEVDRELGDKK